MAHDVGAPQVHEGDVLHALQGATGAREAGRAGEVALRGVAGDDELAAEAHAREEHLHLLGRGVLRLVEDDEGVVHGTATHVGERRDLNNSLLNEGVALLHVRHVEQGVVERAHVGVELLLQGAGQVAQALAGLHHRAAEHDAVDLAALEGGHGHRHGEVGLARAGGAQREGEGVVAHGLDVAALAGRLGTKGATAVGEQDVVGKARVGRGRGAGALKDEVDLLGRGRLAARDHLRELGEHGDDAVCLNGVAHHGHLVAAYGDAGVGCCLDAPEQRVCRAHEARHVDGIRDGESYLGRLHAPPRCGTAGCAQGARHP